MAKSKIAPAISNQSIGELVRRTEENFVSGNNKVSKYVTESPYEDICTIDAYLNSKHISGSTDSFGREKPFANVVIVIRNIWYRSTDIDRKNIRFKASNSKEIIPAFIANIMLQNWMRKENFGSFLNNWGMELAGYNSAVVKFIEQNGELQKMVIPWNRIICDFIDFNSNPKIEILELTPAQLKLKEGYDQDVVERLLTSLTSREQLDKTKKDNNNDYIKLYEVHGNLPKSFLTGDEKDANVYVQQMQVLSFVSGKGGEYDDFVIYKGKEEKDPYVLTSLLPATDGSVSLMGSVKSSFESQWMTNHVAKLTKDQLDFTSNKIYQTTDQNFINQNSLINFALGQVVTTATNTRIEPVNMVADIGALQVYGQQW